jgi:hypothetical protein
MLIYKHIWRNLKAKWDVYNGYIRSGHTWIWNFEIVQTLDMCYEKCFDGIISNTLVGTHMHG